LALVFAIRKNLSQTVLAPLISTNS